jgi:hypothetical protein
LTDVFREFGEIYYDLGLIWVGIWMLCW